MMMMMMMIVRSSVLVSNSSPFCYCFVRSLPPFSESLRDVCGDYHAGNGTGGAANGTVAGAGAAAGHGWVRGAAKVGWKRWRRNLITRVADPATHFKYMENIWISITSDTTRNEDFNARKRGRPDKKCWSLMVFSCMEYMGRNHVRHTIK